MVAGPTNPSLSKLAGSNPARHHFASANGWCYQAFAHLAILSHYGGAPGPGSSRVWTRAPPENTEHTVLGSWNFWKPKPLREVFCLVKNTPLPQEVITMATYGKSPNIGGWMLGCVYPRRTSSDSSCHWLSNFQHSSEFNGDSRGYMEIGMRIVMGIQQG